MNRIVKRDLSYFLLLGIITFILVMLVPLFHLVAVIKAEKDKKRILKYLENKDIIKNENSIHI